MKKLIMLIGKYTFFITTAVFLSLQLQAQNINPGPKKIYKEDEIATLKLVMDPADKAWMLAEENKWSDIYQTAKFSFTNSDIDTTLLFNVGVRLRGNTSRNHPKKSFKIKFKEFGGEKFYDLKKFNLKAEVNDPTMMRELTSLRAFRDMDVPAARSHYTRLYINDEFMGLYLNVEQIDDEFVQRRFTYNAGNIYKCYYGANLSSSSQVYDNSKYELETNKEINDRSKLENFVNVLNNTPSSSFRVEIEKIFDVDRYLRYLAVEALVGHWDGYSYNQNNFYLYENDSTGLIEFIAYDVDNTFGIDWVDRDWGTRDVLDWVRHGNEPRPLSHKILAQNSYFERYKRYLDELLNTFFTTENYNAVFDNYEVLLTDVINQDTYFPQSFGFTPSDFHLGIESELLDHWWLPYGLKNYVSIRASTARDQVGVVTSIESNLVSEIAVYPNPSRNGNFIIKTPVPNAPVQLNDFSGKTVEIHSKTVSENTIQVNHNLPPGLYILSVSGITQKIIIR